MDARLLSSRAGAASCSGMSLSCQGRALPFAGSTAAFRPAACRGAVGRRALSVECKESRVGKVPIAVPTGVTVTVQGNKLTAKGQAGVLEQTFDPELVEVKQDDNGLFRVYKRIETKQANMAHGLIRSLLASMVEGLSTGFTKSMSLIGVGYRAAVSGKELTLNLGYSNPVTMSVPEGISVQVEKQTTLHIKGFDKAKVGQFAADVRFKRPPEPYKGKGVRYVDEFVRKKEGKKGKK